MFQTIRNLRKDDKKPGEYENISDVASLMRAMLAPGMAALFFRNAVDAFRYFLLPDVGVFANGKDDKPRPAHVPWLGACRNSILPEHQTHTRPLGLVWVVGENTNNGQEV